MLWVCSWRYRTVVPPPGSNSPFTSLGIRSLHPTAVQYKSPRTCWHHFTSTRKQLLQLGSVVFTKFSSVCNILLFDVRVFQVHVCVWLGWNPREENRPPCWKNVVDIIQTCFRQGKLSLAKERVTWIRNGKRQAEWYRQSTKCNKFYSS